MRKQGSCLEKGIMQGTMPGARRRGRPRTAWMDNVKTWTGLPVEYDTRFYDTRCYFNVRSKANMSQLHLRINQNDRGQGLMEKVRPSCGQPSDRGRLKNRTEQNMTKSAKEGKGRRHAHRPRKVCVCACVCVRACVRACVCVCVCCSRICNSRIGLYTHERTHR